MWRKMQYKESNDDSRDDALPFVSVLIAARNEEDHIISCVESCLQQNYPAHKFEVIVVDDQSEDDTYELLEENIKDPRFKLMRLGVARRTTIQGSKKKAISYGVNHAAGDIILTSDADCSVPNRWIRSMVSCIVDTHADLVTGPVDIKNENTVLNRFQQLDFINSCVMNAAGIKARLHYFGNAANMIFRKKVFMEVSGYEGNESIASGDDVFMMKKIAAQSPSKIQFNKSKEAIVTSFGKKKLSSFFSQRLRWAGKMSHLFSLKIFAILSIVFWQRILVIASFIIGVIMQQYILIYIAASCLVLRWIVDAILHGQACDFYDKKSLLKWSVPMNILYTIYFIILSILTLMPLRLEWKDRKI